ncbi:PEP/pyruvate-binding domain-containing protein [Desulforamulus aeronauticus]|uniref:Pyruvate, water dikinase n=1 Tax=Desulforamulus aeronauticus DSM 10349 TaxID=1121421 RepID=A0A1M6QCC2_9FIRM|nr:PEP/pyruvate-binding domain-containing protein [Desulforamulus aeronauticus]SHK17816.1 pyruvate, water dikinase [Desulforamulus aeronauticus DSM 10349]
MSEFIKSFNEVNAKDVAIVGGKGANLGDMARAGFPVPMGFCITVEAYRKFMEKIDIGEIPVTRDKVALKSREIVGKIHSEKIPEELSTAILNAFNSFGFDKLVAVRSSATAEDLPESSFAGQQASYLNVNEEGLLESIKKCWASLWTERAIHYRINNEFDHNKVFLAIVVQQMVSAEAAGVAFSVNPLTLDSKQLVIESAWGLGEEIVSGQINPDRFIVDKTNRKILHQEIAEKENIMISSKASLATSLRPPDTMKNASSLSDEQIMELTKNVCDIEEHFGYPQDIEWALSDNRFYILQSRPITTLNRQLPLEKAEDLHYFNFDPALEWTNMQWVRERYHQPMSVLGWSILEPCQSEGLRYLCEIFLGRKLPADYKFYAWIHGYLYQNFTIMKEFYPSLAMDAILTTDEEKRFRPRHNKIQDIIRALNMFFKVKKLNAMLDKAFNKSLPGYLQEIRRLEASKLKQFNNIELYQYILTCRELGRSYFQHQLVSGLVADNYYTILSKIMVKWMNDDLSLSAKLVSGLPNNLTVETNDDVWRLSQTLRNSPQLLTLFITNSTKSFLNQADHFENGRHFISELNTLLKKHGHLNTNMDIAKDFWWENPDIVFSLVRGFLSTNDNIDPLTRGTEKRNEREITGKYVHSKLSFIKRYIFNKVLQPTQTYMLLRDNRHYYITMPFSLIKKATNELAHRLQEEGKLKNERDIYYLSIDEVGRIVNGELDIKNADQLIALRKSLKKIDIDALPALFKGWPQIKNDSNKYNHDVAILKGIGGSPGIASGSVKVIRSLADFAQFKAGDVLIANNTDPAWTPLFAIASAVVTNYGGLLSHGAIVAREYGIPAVLGVANVTESLTDGQVVEVNGNNGTVSLL